jgi:nucleoside-diphosphate-sugar epimerase
MQKLIFGCGYLGSRVARLWQAAGDEVSVVTRSERRAAELQALGYRALVADITRPETLVDLPEAATVLFAVGFERPKASKADPSTTAFAISTPNSSVTGPGAAAQTIADVYVGGLHNVLAALPTATGRFIYISSTGVYGSGQGDWVDESTATNPVREGGRACLAAEELLRAHTLGQRAIVLRLAGIYGPGRIPRAEALRAGEPIAAPAEGFLNLIHVDDAAAIALVAEQHATPPCLYIVSDGHPGQRQEYYAELARLLGAPPPRFTAPDPASPAAARASSDKRASNARLLAELPVRLCYPSFREGLAEILKYEI